MSSEINIFFRDVAIGAIKREFTRESSILPWGRGGDTWSKFAARFLGKNQKLSPRYEIFLKIAFFNFLKNQASRISLF
jgi:hypothetical protein